MSKIALTMIVAGDEDPKELDRCLEHASPFVDGVFITITTKKKDDALLKIAKKYKAKVDYQPTKFFVKITGKQIKWLEKFFGHKASLKEGDKIFQFDKARNYSMGMILKEYEWFMWLDVDDILRGGNKIKDIVETCEINNIDSAFLNYLYQVDIEDGRIKNVLIEHLRERIMRTGVYEWVAPIHETLIEKRPTRKVDFKEADVVHLSNSERRQGALRRNIKTLEYSVFNTKGKDPRPVYYLAKAYFDVWLQEDEPEIVDKAKALFEKYIAGDAMSGWPAERAQCWEYLAEICRAKNEYNNAIKCAHNAMIEDESSPSIWVSLALTYILKKEWKRALFWVRMATKVKSPKTTLVSNPRDLAARSLEVVYHASINMSKLDEAAESAQKLLEIHPESKEMQDRVLTTSRMKEQRELTKDVINLAKKLSNGEAEKIKPLLMAIPNDISNNPMISDLKNKFNPPRTWGKKEIAIYCGPGATPWSPKHLSDPGGSFIGGSEEAVIYLTRELVKQGWDVTVFSDPGADEGEYDGVHYLPYFKFNPQDEYNILVIWRRPGLVDNNYKANKIYIWCHDIVNQLDFTPERMDKIHKVMVLSPWHRTNIPDVPDNKILITGNGINI